MWVRYALLMLFGLSSAGCPKGGTAGQRLSAAEAPLVVTVEAIAETQPGMKAHWELLDVERGKTEEGSTTLVYEYNYLQKSQLDPWISTTILVTASEPEAKSAYQALMTVARDHVDNLNAKTGRKDLVPWGEEYSCSPILRGQDTIGNLCGFRKDTRVFVYFAVGVGFGSPDDMAALLKPRLSALEFWTP